ncbi:MAG TPA: hypothetical protein PK725_05280 [Rhodocyclaceae bacterium]|jgi:hypothetical protein|nr:hypothetical protein [Rhodocyclaceae bacterium]HRQ46337.1 hypothetical protein [Rhodocyclaceae bacterium]
MNIALPKLPLALGYAAGGGTRTGSGALLAATWMLLATPAVRTWLETSMSVHMLVQIPLLAAIGIVAMRLLPGTTQNMLLAAAGGAIPCVLIATFASSYWMLPRAIDAVLVDPLAEAAKFVSLPLLVGAPLALAWRQLGLIGRGFVWTNFISMLAVLGWLYIVAPVRVCNSYALFEQERAGWLMVQLAVGLLVWWLGRLFVGAPAATSPPCGR